MTAENNCWHKTEHQRSTKQWWIFSLAHTKEHDEQLLCDWEECVSLTFNYSLFHMPSLSADGAKLLPWPQTTLLKEIIVLFCLLGTTVSLWISGQFRGCMSISEFANNADAISCPIKATSLSQKLVPFTYLHLIYAPFPYVNGCIYFMTWAVLFYPYL